MNLILRHQSVFEVHEGTSYNVSHIQTSTQAYVMIGHDNRIDLNPKILKVVTGVPSKHQVNPDMGI